MGVLVGEAPKSFALLSASASARAKDNPAAMVGRGRFHDEDEDEEDEERRRYAAPVRHRPDVVVAQADKGELEDLHWAPPPPRPKKTWIRHFFANGTV